MRKQWFVAVSATLFVSACASGTPATGSVAGDGSVAVYGITQTSVSAAVGQEVLLTLGTVGPGAFDSLPVVSSTAVRFVDAAYVGPYLPSGPTQLFRFTATAPGRAVVSFQHTGGIDGARYMVTDTIDVR